MIVSNVKNKSLAEIDKLFDDLIFAINNNESTSNYIFHEDDAHIKRYKAKLIEAINSLIAAARKDELELATIKRMDNWSSRKYHQIRLASLEGKDANSLH